MAAAAQLLHTQNMQRVTNCCVLSINHSLIAVHWIKDAVPWQGWVWGSNGRGHLSCPPFPGSHSWDACAALEESTSPRQLHS